MLKEKKILVAIVDILTYIGLSLDPKQDKVDPWVEEQTKQKAKSEFEHFVKQSSNLHLRQIVQLCYKVLQWAALENPSNGKVLTTFVPLLLGHSDADVGATECLSAIFSGQVSHHTRFLFFLFLVMTLKLKFLFYFFFACIEQLDLLNQLSEDIISLFVKNLASKPGDSALLRFISSICATQNAPSVKNQAIVFNLIKSLPKVFLQMKTNKTGNVSCPMNDRILFELRF